MTATGMRVVRPLVSLKKQAVDHLRAAIVDGRLRPGQRLVERELCETLDVSRTLVREALSQLEVEGLVQIVPHRGPMVAAYTAEETIGIYEVRAVLEELAGRQFVERATAAERSALRQALHSIEEVYRDPAGSNLLAAKAQFYLALADGTHNPVLVETLRHIHGRVTLLRASTLAQPGRPAAALAEMAEIVRQIEKGDAVAAGRACRRHVENALAIAVKILSEAGQAASPARENPVPPVGDFR